MKFNQLNRFIEHFQKEVQHPFILLINYSIEGDDKFFYEWLIDEYRERLGNFKKLDGESLTLHQLLEEFQPNFGFDKLDTLITLQAEKIKTALVKSLQEVINHPSGMHQIFIAMGLKDDHQLYKIVSESGLVLDLVSEKSVDRENRYALRLAKYINNLGMKIAPNVCHQMVKHLGENVALLQHEADKLACYCGQKQEIRASDVVAICPKTNKETLWQLGEALLKNDKRAALMIGRSLLEDGAGLVSLIKALRAQFQISFQVASRLQQADSIAQIQRDFPYMKGWLLNHHLSLAKGFGFQNFSKALQSIDQIDLLSRSGIDDPSLLMELLIFKI